MIKTSFINAKLFLLFLLFFCFPLLFPQIESKFILIQFSIIIPLYLLINLFTASSFIQFQIIIFILLNVLMIGGMPGSIPGWMSMVCLGYLFGIRSAKSYKKILLELKPFVICSIIMCLWVLMKNFNETFNYELLSDYFDKSSINTVPILIVCGFNLYCSVLFYSISKNYNAVELKKEFRILFFLLLTAILSVITFDFRSGFIIFITALLITFQFINAKLGKLFFFLILILFIYFFYSSNFYDLLVFFITQGGDDLFSISYELSYGALRFDRIINFWEISSLSKFNFSSWSDHFSISGISDFTSALFPLSLIFLLYPISGTFKLFLRIFKKNKLIFFIMFSCLLSSLIISLLQPDFFSLFTFISIFTMIYYGEKKFKTKLIESS